MDPDVIRAKFGDAYVATERTFIMGISPRFTTLIAERFRGRHVLETCTGAGFTTIALARVAAHVTTVEIDPTYQTHACKNVGIANLLDRVTFLLGDALDDRTWSQLPPIDAAFLDPDWAITGPGHVHHFLNSTTRPPADALLERTLRATPNVALILPPQLDLTELAALPPHELQRLYLGESHELYCLYFGDLATSFSETDLRV